MVKERAWFTGQSQWTMLPCTDLASGDPSPGATGKNQLSLATETKTTKTDINTDVVEEGVCTWSRGRERRRRVWLARPHTERRRATGNLLWRGKRR